MKSYDIPGTSCPTCGKHFDKVAKIHGKDAPPKKGDLTICIGCEAVLVYVDAATVAEASPEMLAKCSERIRDIVSKLKQFVRCYKIANDYSKIGGGTSDQNPSAPDRTRIQDH